MLKLLKLFIQSNIIMNCSLVCYSNEKEAHYTVNCNAVHFPSYSTQFKTLNREILANIKQNYSLLGTKHSRIIFDSSVPNAALANVSHISSIFICINESGCFYYTMKRKLWNQTNETLLRIRSRKVFLNCCNIFSSNSLKEILPMPNCSTNIMFSAKTVSHFVNNTRNQYLRVNYSPRARRSVRKFDLSAYSSLQLPPFTKTDFLTKIACGNHKKCDLCKLKEGCEWMNNACVLKNNSELVNCGFAQSVKGPVLSNDILTYQINMDKLSPRTNYISGSLLNDNLSLPCDPFNHTRRIISCSIAYYKPGKYFFNVFIKNKNLTRRYAESTNWTIEINTTSADPCAPLDSCLKCQTCTNQDCSWTGKLCEWGMKSKKTVKCFNFISVIKIQPLFYKLSYEDKNEDILFQKIQFIKNRTKINCAVATQDNNYVKCRIADSTKPNNYKVVVKVRFKQENCTKLHNEEADFNVIINENYPFLGDSFDTALVYMLVSGIVSIIALVGYILFGKKSKTNETVSSAKKTNPTLRKTTANKLNVSLKQSNEMQKSFTDLSTIQSNFPSTLLQKYIEKGRQASKKLKKKKMDKKMEKLNRY